MWTYDLPNGEGYIELSSFREWNALWKEVTELYLLGDFGVSEGVMTEEQVEEMIVQNLRKKYQVKSYTDDQSEDREG